MRSTAGGGVDVLPSRQHRREGTRDPPPLLEVGVPVWLPTEDACSLQPPETPDFL